MSSQNKRRLSRRRLLKSGALAAASIVSLRVSRHAFAQAREGEVVFAGLAGSIQDVFEKDIIPKFTSQTGIKVTYIASTPNQVVAKVRAQGGAGELDVIQLAGATVFNAIDLGLIENVDWSLVPNAKELNPKISREPQIVPLSVSGVAMIYNKTAFAKNGWSPPTDWMDWWDPKFAGHVALHGMETNATAGVLSLIAKIVSGDPNNFDAAFAKIKELRPNLYQIFANSGASEVAWRQGAVWIGEDGYPRTLQWAQEGLSFLGFVFPKSGVPCYDVDLAILKGAAHPKAAYAWIDFLLDKNIQIILAEKTGYSPSIKGITLPQEVQRFLPPDELIWFPDWRTISKSFKELAGRWMREIEH